MNIRRTYKRLARISLSLKQDENRAYDAIHVSPNNSRRWISDKRPRHGHRYAHSFSTPLDPLKLATFLFDNYFFIKYDC